MALQTARVYILNRVVGGREISISRCSQLDTARNAQGAVWLSSGCRALQRSLARNECDYGNLGGIQRGYQSRATVAEHDAGSVGVRGSIPLISIGGSRACGRPQALFSLWRSVAGVANGSVGEAGVRQFRWPKRPATLDLGT